MPAESLTRILTLNSGSSSLKFAYYLIGRAESCSLMGKLDRIGLANGLLRAKNSDGTTVIDRAVALPDHDAALKCLLDWLHEQAPAPDAVGHRVVHGGPHFSEPSRITSEVMGMLQQLVYLAPNHLPHEIKTIQAISRRYPTLPQVACFDTAFHRQMPAKAQIYALPRAFRKNAILRYGFHGLSYEYIMEQLRKEVPGKRAAEGRVIIAHLGNGASMAAVKNGQCVDTTMGLTPTGGLMMSTRTGDLDPGVLLFLLREKGLSVAQVEDVVNHQSGLLGVSGLSSDMQDLLAQETGNPQAAEAIALFCYQAKKFLGALAAALGGLDTLVFTAGIGENAPAIRWRICEDLAFLGIHLDRGRNDANSPIISRNDSPVSVRVMKTNEELMIARQTYALLNRNA
jgi:acetate kinase